ncbi:TonB-dependent receptor [Pseudoduganella namucuonensis]|uniref:Outer membrane receptor proteins, mostly Fe transport n=1 Tax=Pseudoduganella namucuonensis TaxID=1035707 RepID=A0A1I7IW58_9BURK|nr:TonB-dependent receptor [Pseudoduganella namucuonensis]SFU77170.1 Outer membrane receptor proteins, mostly Fe transport [Pseudoduganella namucuonensis]
MSDRYADGAARAVEPLLYSLSTLLIALSPAAAQETAAAATASVQVLGHYDNGVGTSDAASQGVVTAALIANRPALRPGELLEFVPGVIVTQHSGDGKANQYFLRGFNLDHGTDFATHVDGMPVNMRTHAHGQGYTDLNFLIPELVDRVSYKKGTYYADEGDFSSAGAARMSIANKVKEGTATLAMGGNDYLRGLVANSMPLAGGNLLYALELAHNDGPWSTPESFRKQAGVLRYSAGARDSQYSVTAMAYKGAWHASTQIPLRAVDSAAMRPYDAVDPSDGGDTARYSLSFDTVRRNADGQFRATAYAVRSDLTLFGNYTYYLDDPVNGDQARQTERRRMLGFDVAQTWFGKLAGMDMSNRVGLQARHDDIAPLALYATSRQRVVRTISESRVKEGSAGLWFDNTLQWNDWLRTVAGARYDSYRFDVASDIAENSGKVDAHIASPKLAVVLGPWNKTEFFVNAGAGFHSNDARGTTVHLTPKEREPAEPVTPLVRTRGSEVGVRTELAPGLQSSIALWRLRSASELVFSGDAGDTAPSRGSQRSGVELNNHYIANSWLLFDLDLAYSRARYTETDAAGGHIPGAVGKVASFGATVHDLGPWSGAFQLRYFGPRPLIEDDSRRSASSAIAYLRTSYKLSRRWQLSLDIFNLFNRRINDIDYYYASRLPGEPAGGVEDMHFHPAEPRSYRLTLKAGF